MTWETQLVDLVHRLAGRPRGRLHTAVQLVADAATADVICRTCQISAAMHPAEEVRLVRRWLDEPWATVPVTGVGARLWQALRRWCGAALAERTLSPERALRAALLLSGLVHAIGRDCVLALVVPTAQVPDLEPGPASVSLTRVTALLEQAIYFRSSSAAVATATEQELALAEAAAGTTSPRPQDVYLRLEITPGHDLAGVATLHALKNRLRDGPADRQVRLIRRCPLTPDHQRCLHDFHRV